MGLKYCKNYNCKITVINFYLTVTAESAAQAGENGGSNDTHTIETEEGQSYAHYYLYLITIYYNFLNVTLGMLSL